MKMVFEHPMYSMETWLCHVTNLSIIGKFLYEDLIPDRKLVDTIPLIDEEERDNFLSFAKMMLAWLPEERKTARELLDHPFIQLEQKATGPKDNKG
jgi:hypothetical protein